MEVLAAIKGLEAVPEGTEVTIHSDSRYLVHTMTRNWKRNANRDLWDQLDRLCGSRKVDWEWVKGHAGDAGNEEADAWAGWEAGLREKRPIEPVTRDNVPRSRLAHLDEEGRASMVDVGSKDPTEREAIARGFVTMKAETLSLIKDGEMHKGDVLATARLAGILGAKQTPQLIPLCHPIPLDQVTVDFGVDSDRTGIHIIATAKAEARTGVEMEALTAVSVAALTLYDMCKSVDRGMRIQDIRLVRKSGGESGEIVLES